MACRKRGEQLHIQVWDTGPGIAPADQEAIFNEFVQLNNPERDRNKGLGLGLAIARRLGLAMNVPVQLRSVLGKGSVFTIILPLANPQQLALAEQMAQSAVQVQVTSQHNLKGLRLAFIDDERDIVQVVHRFASANQYLRASSATC